MAKRKDRKAALADITKGTTAARSKVADAMRTQTRPQPDATNVGQQGGALGVYLTKDERDTLQAIADSFHASRGSLLTVAVRYFLERWQAGEVDLHAERLKFTGATAKRR